MEAYKEGFSAVGFNCEDENVRTGVVNLSDAVQMITELTRDGGQVENIFNNLDIIIFNQNSSVTMTCLLSQCVLTNRRVQVMEISE